VQAQEQVTTQKAQYKTPDDKSCPHLAFRHCLQVVYLGTATSLANKVSDTQCWGVTGVLKHHQYNISMHTAQQLTKIGVLTQVTTSALPAHAR
jgi:hypothetical protein